MTENKRFKYCMFDGFEENGEGLDFMAVEDRLNQLYEDNERLKEENKELKQKLKEMIE